MFGHYLRKERTLNFGYMLVNKKNLVVFSPFVPESNAGHAGGVYLYSHLSELQNHFKITLISFETSENLKSLGDLDLDIDVVLAPKLASSGIRSKKAIDNLFRVFSSSLLPKAFLLNLKANTRIARLVVDAHLVEFQWGEMSSAINFVRKLNRKAHTYVFAHDIIRQRNKRILLTFPPITRPLLWLYFSKVAWLEQQNYKVATRVAVFSSKDQGLLAEMGIGHSLVVHPPMPEVNAVLPDSGSQDLELIRAVFVGAMDRPENHDAMVWFLNKVWPHVITQKPMSQLIIVGAKPKQELVLLASKFEHVTVTGFVDDITPYLSKSNIFVAPLLRGAGVKFKVLQAQSLGLPVVGTEIAFEGIPRANGTFVANNADEMSNMLLDDQIRLMSRIALRDDFINKTGGHHDAETWKQSLRAYFQESWPDSDRS